MPVIEIEKPDPLYWSAFRLIKTPSILSEFTRSTEFERFGLWPKQRIEMNRESLHKKKIQGRNLGKSITATDEIISKVLIYNRREAGLALIGTRSHQTLQHIFETMLVPQFTRDPFLRVFLLPGDRGIDRKNFELRLTNGTVIKGRIQGKDGQGFNTVHPNIAAWFDEVQFLSNDAVAEIYGMLGADTPILASGVPNGVRSSWAYRIDTNPGLGFKGARMTRLDDPRATPEWIEEMKILYGGENSSLYQQKMLGEWGMNMRMTFDIERMTHDLPVKEFENLDLPPWYRSISVDPKNFEAGDEGVLDSMFQIGSIRGLPVEPKEIWIHADHGITGSPTTGYVSFYDEKAGAWRQMRRFLVYQLQAEDNATVFDFLARSLESRFGVKPWIGIDTTGQGGQAVASILERREHKVIWANLAKNVMFEDRLETDEELQERMLKEIFWVDPEKIMVPVEMPLKQVAIPRLRDEMYRGNLWIINQAELWTQFETTTETTTERGTQQKYVTDFTYEESPNYDHDLQAFEVWAAMMVEKDNAERLEDLSPDVFIEEIEVPW